MTVVITGASGHVGGNLVRALLGRGDAVRVLVHRNTRALEGLDVERVSGDVLDAASLRKAFEGADVLLHLAAVISIDGDKGGRVTEVNVTGAANAAQAALDVGVRRMVHVSSVHAYEQSPLDQPLFETRAKVRGPGHPAYDRSKAAGEERVRAVVTKGLDAVIVNPTGIFGPLDFAPSRMGRLFLDVAHGRLPALLEGGFDFVDVRDVTASVLAAAERGRAGENYLLGGHWVGVGELIGTFCEIAGVPVPRFTCPMWIARLAAPFAQLHGRVVGREPLFTSESLLALRANRQIVHDKAARELGHAPRPVRETLEDVYAWFREQGLLEAARGEATLPEPTGE